MADGIPVEFHAHCNSGLAPYVTVIAEELGITTIHTAIPPLANGSSQPSVFSVVENLRARGLDVDLDLEPLKRAAAHLGEVARREGLPVGEPMEYDERLYSHQVPGGMISNLRFQLAQLRQEDRLSEVLEEVARVRSDFGYPIMVTPLSQFVGTQAVINVVTGKRYETVTDESIRYAWGKYGREATAHMDPAVRELILGRPRGEELARDEDDQLLTEASVDELRAQVNPALSDDDLIVHYFLGSSASSVTIPVRGRPPRSYEEYRRRHPTALDLLRTVAEAKTIRSARFIDRRDVSDIR